MSIKPSISTASTAESAQARTPRPRGTSTLLSTVTAPSIGSTVGLALVRLEHLRHSGTLVAEASEKQSWTVEPWWSDWWPEQPPADEVQDLNSL
jgi:transferase CAF17, mitochondrial